MGKQVLTGAQTVSFAGLDFDANVVGWGDSRKPRMAYHEYLKRDGAEAEYMGRSPFKVRFQVVYVGANWQKDYQRFLSTIDSTPIGTLMHPAIGKINAACDGIDQATVNVETAIDTISFEVSFTESNLDQKLNSTAAGPAGKQSLAGTYISQLSTVTTAYLTASAAIALYTANAGIYCAAAVATVQGGAPDSTLRTQLANVVANATAARNAIRSDPAYSNDALSFPALSAVELVLDACNQLDDALRSVKPQILQYTVPSPMSLLAISQKFYGRDAASRLDEIRANNQGKIPNPSIVLGGTVLSMAAPTVQVRR